MAGKEGKNLPYDLENLSIPELEVLLQQDFLASDGSSPDVDYIMAIVEVIHKKEQAQPGYHPLDTAKAWEEFETFYILEGGANSIDCSDGESEGKKVPSQTPKQSSRREKSKTFRRCLLIAASLCLLVALTCVPVFGYHSFVQMLASWTAEQFGFYMPPETRSTPEQVPVEFAELQDIMQQFDTELIVPKFPEGFEVRNTTLSYFPDNSTLEFTIMYQQESNYYIFSVCCNGNNVINLYEKSDSLVETKEYNGIKYYYLENNTNSTVAWYVDTVEYCIVTNQTTSELEKILEPIYSK